MHLWPHQEKARQQLLDTCNFILAWEPGTGKTLTVLSSLQSPTLVLAPKTLVYSVWWKEAQALGMPVTVYGAGAKRKSGPEDSKASLVITNHDGIHDVQRWFWLPRTVVIDESLAFANAATQRYKSLWRYLTRIQPDRLILLNGTLFNRSVQAVYNQVRLLYWQNAKNCPLGASLTMFRAKYCNKVILPYLGIAKWEDRPWAVAEIKTLLLHHRLASFIGLDDVCELPEQAVQHFYLPITQKIKNQLWGMEWVSGLKHLGLQDERLELIAELIQQDLGPVVVMSHWVEQRAKLMERVKDRPCFEIGGDTHNRAQIVQQFLSSPNGVLFLSPQAASHGLTLTNAKTLIWASTPPGRCDLWLQANARIRRPGQKERTRVWVTSYLGPERAVWEVIQAGGDMIKQMHAWEAATHEDTRPVAKKRTSHTDPVRLEARA